MMDQDDHKSSMSKQYKMHRHSFLELQNSKSPRAETLYKQLNDLNQNLGRWTDISKAQNLDRNGNYIEVTKECIPSQSSLFLRNVHKGWEPKEW